MADSEVALLNHKLQEAVRVNKLLLDRIQDLELELAQARQMGYQFQANGPIAATQSTPKHSPPAPSYVPTAKPSAGRHKRTETPEQRFIKQFTPTKVYTMGMEPQNDRGLLHDFFEDIRKWAIRHTVDLDGQQIARCSSYRPLVDMIGNKSDIQHLLADHEMLHDIVAALIIRDIVHYAIGEASLIHSDHRAAYQCRDLVTGFALLLEDDVATKHEFCLHQQAFYKELYEEHGHKEWRTKTADGRTDALLVSMFPFLAAKVNADAQHWLGELYVKGYRIGIRLRSNAVKWQILFPVAGMQFDGKRMNNRSLKLAGDPMTTWKELANNPSKFFVRFAITPTITKSDFSTGFEVKEVVHSSLVHTGRQDVFSHKKDSQVGPVKDERRSHHFR